MWPTQLAFSLFIVCKIFLFRSRDSIVSIATRYDLGLPGIESRSEARFFAPVQTSSEAHPVSYIMGTGSFLGVNWQGHGVEYPPPSSAVVKERVELYLYSLSGPLWSVLGRNLPLPVPLGYFFPSSWCLEILNFSLDRSIWSSLSLSSTTFQNVPNFYDQLTEACHWQHHTCLCSKCSTLLRSSLNLSPIGWWKVSSSCWMLLLWWQAWIWFHECWTYVRCILHEMSIEFFSKSIIDIIACVDS